MPTSLLRRPWLAALALAALPLAQPALADQFKQSADGGTVDCAVSARELTRFALVGDQFASVSKLSSGYPYNDFAVTNEPLRGDIYVSVPETFAGSRISFFATTKLGYVYKFSCAIDQIEAAQIFITNPAIATDEARRWEEQSGPGEAVIRLIQAMAAQQLLPGFEIRHSIAPPRRVGELEIQQIAEYRGAALAGKTLRVANRSGAAVTIAERDLAGPNTLGIALPQPSLKPGASTTAFVVGPNGETSHD